MTDQALHRCPFCEFDRSQKRDDPDYSHVSALRQIAVHIVWVHAEEFHELAETVSDEWVGRFVR